VLVVFSLLYLYTKQQKVSKNWGDVGNALRYAVATAMLRALAWTQTSDFHAKIWRPQLLTAVDADDCGNPTNLHVLALAKQLQYGGGGIHMVTSIMTRPVGMDHYETCELMQHSKTLLQRHMAMNGQDDCFAQVSATTNNPSQSLCSAVVHSGIGPLSPNTVLITYPTTGRTPERMDDFVSSLRGIMNLQKAVTLFQGSPDCYAIPLPSRRELATSRDSSTIEVWWVVHDRGLLLLLPYILSKHE
jgi:potassium/chloride transporter 4/5/6